MRKIYQQDLRFPELIEELTAANLVPDSLEWKGITALDERRGIANWAACTFADNLLAQYDAVFAAHSIAIIDTNRAADNTADSNDNTQARQAVNQLTTYIDTFPTLTAAQRNDALLLVLRILRLLLRRLIKRGTF